MKPYLNNVQPKVGEQIIFTCEYGNALAGRISNIDESRGDCCLSVVTPVYGGPQENWINPKTACNADDAMSAIKVQTARAVALHDGQQTDYFAGTLYTRHLCAVSGTEFNEVDRTAWTALKSDPVNKKEYNAWIQVALEAMD